MTTVTDWRRGLPARLGAAAVVGTCVGAAMLLAGNLMPVARVPVDCRPAGGVGCAILQPITGILLGLLLWVLVVAAVGYLIGGLLVALSGRLAGIRVGITPVVAWPFMLWVMVLLVQSFGGSMRLAGAPVVGYEALAYVVLAAVSAPQLRLAVRLTGIGLIAVAVVVALAVR